MSEKNGDELKGHDTSVLNRINYDSGQVTPRLTKADDECYTDMQDIMNELSHWKDKFAGKKIICPCDWDILNSLDGGESSNVYSIRIDFDEDKIHGHTNTVKSVTYSLFDFQDEINQEVKSITVDKDEINEFLSNRVQCNFIQTFIQNGKEWKVKSITASGYNPATGLGLSFEDVDFTKYDICVTNPPFSQIPKFLQRLIDSGIDFIVLAPFLNRVTPSVGLHLMKKEAYLGYNRQIHVDFNNPTANNKFHTKRVCVDWITSFSDAQDKVDKEKRLKTGIRYADYKDQFKFMENMTMKDGTHPLQIKNSTIIPDDYYGWMFCSVGILDELSNDEFEWYMTNAKKYYNDNPDLSPFKHKATNAMILAQRYIDFEALGLSTTTQQEKYCSNLGEHGFHGLVIRRKINAKNSK